jgi:ribosome maturation factor RimP
MAKKQTNLDALRPFCEATAAQMGLEFCDVLMEKEPQGRYLRFYVDKEGGLSLDDCERFHHAVQPKAEAIDYDFMEVCSPGLDRPVKTERDIRKALGTRVSVHLYRPENGSKLFEGILTRMDDEAVVIEQGTGELTFARKAVSLVRLVPDLSALEDDSEGVVIESDELPDE